MALAEITVAKLLLGAILGSAGYGAVTSYLGGKTELKKLAKQMNLEKYATEMAEMIRKRGEEGKRQQLAGLMGELRERGRTERGWAAAGQILQVGGEAQNNRLALLMQMAQGMGQTARGAVAGTQSVLGPMSMYLARR